MARKVQPREVKTQPLVLEISDSMHDMLAALQCTGLYGPSVETAAERVLEQAIFAMVMDEGGIELPMPPRKKSDL